MTAVEKRKIAHKNSSLPPSFYYKIRNAFYMKRCPICNSEMRRHEFTDKRIPTIQHNIPLSLGGVHEIHNISVICRSCNASINNKVTGDLNQSEVERIWNEMV